MSNFGVIKWMFRGSRGWWTYGKRAFIHLHSKIHKGKISAVMQAFRLSVLAFFSASLFLGACAAQPQLTPAQIQARSEAREHKRQEELTEKRETHAFWLEIMRGLSEAHAAGKAGKVRKAVKRYPEVMKIAASDGSTFVGERKTPTHGSTQLKFGFQWFYRPELDDKTYILWSYLGSSSREAGLEPGDVIEAIGGIPLAGKSYNEVNASIDVPSGAVLKMTLAGRDGNPSRTVSFKRKMSANRSMGNDIVAEVVRLAAALDPPMAQPEDAENHMVEARVHLKHADQTRDYLPAIKSMEAAVSAGPWWADNYYNLALIQEKNEDFYQAAYNYKNFLFLNPDSFEAGAVRNKIVELKLEAKLAAPRTRWEGLWGVVGGSIARLKIDRQNNAVFRFTQVSSVDSGAGNRVGGTHGTGRLSGNSLKGHFKINYVKPRARKCWGANALVPFTGILAADAKTMKFYYNVHVYHRYNCQLLRWSEASNSPITIHKLGP